MTGPPAENKPPVQRSAAGARFDLHFYGELRPGYPREKTIAAFARLFGIQDHERTERLFQGHPVTLRRRLDRDEAAQLYVLLRRIGMVVELRTATTDKKKDGNSTSGKAEATPPTPNLYTLTPCNSDPGLPVRCRQLSKTLGVLAAFATLAVIVLTALYAGLPNQSPLPILRAASVSVQGKLWLASDLALLEHDRSGVAHTPVTLASLGITDPVVALTTGNTDQLWLLTQADDGVRLLQDCHLETASCSARITGELLNLHWLPHNEQLLVAHRGGLRLLDENTQALALKERAMPETPYLAAVEGLLYMNSPEGPALSVLRQEAAYFAEQIDELLLLPPHAQEAGLVHSGAFARLSDDWWVTLSDPSGTQQLHRFDAHWQALGEVPLPESHRIDALLAWGEQILVVDFRKDYLLRFNGAGVPLAPLVVSAHQAQRSALVERTANRRLLWQYSGWLLVIIALGTGTLGLWQYLRARTLEHTTLPQTTLPLPSPETLLWLPHDSRRLPRLLFLTSALALLALITVSLPAVFTVTLSGVLLLLASAALGLWWLARAPLDRLALHGSQLVLVDHRGHFRCGPAREASWNGWFLALGDLIIFTGATWLPALDTTRHTRELGLLLNHSKRLSALNTVILLLNNRHPLGIALLLLSGATAGLVLMQAA